MELQNIYTEVIEELKCVVGCSNNNSELQIFANAVKIDRCAQKLLKSVRTKFIDVLGGEENSFHEETLFDIIKNFFVEDTTTTTPVKSSPKQTSKITMATTTTTKAAAAAEVPVHKKSFHKPAAATATTSSNLTPIVVAPRPVVVPLPVPKLPPPPPPPAITTTEEEEDNNNKRKRGRRPKNEKRSMKLKSSLPDDLPDLSPPAGIKELERFETFSFNSLPKWSSSSSGGGDKMEF